MHLLVEGIPLINPTAGIIYAASHEIYPIVGKFSFLMTDEDGKQHPDYSTPEIMFRETSSRLCYALSEIMIHFGWANTCVICDDAFNPPELLKQGKICVLLQIQPRLVAETYSDRFILGRHVDPKGNTFLTVKGMASSMAHSILPADRL